LQQRISVSLIVAPFPEENVGEHTAESTRVHHRRSAEPHVVNLGGRRAVR
jgi:hypothetical protein